MSSSSRATSPTWCRRASWPSPAPSLTSGLSFTADSRSLYFVAVDLISTYQAARLLRYDLATDRLAVVNRNVGGPGGSISPDGGQYVFARANGDHHDLATLDLHTGQLRILRQESPGAFLAGPRFSPDGARLVATHFDGTEFRIAVLDARDGRLLTTISPQGSPSTTPLGSTTVGLSISAARARISGFRSTSTISPPAERTS